MTTKSQSDEAAAPSLVRRNGLHRTEILGVMVGLSLFVAVATVVSSRKQPHADQVIDADIAFHLVATGRRLSCALSYAVPGDVAPSGWPVYDLALASWLTLWGTTRTAMAAFYPVIVAVVCVIILAFLRRTALVRSPGERAALTVAIPFLPAVVSVCLKSRYDAMGMLGMAVALIALTVPQAMARLALVAIAGLVVGSGGFNVTLASAPFVAILLACTNFRYLRECALYLACVAGGLGIAFGKMYVDGTLGDFLDCMRLSGMDAAGVIRGRSIQFRVAEPYLLLLVCAFLWFDRRRELIRDARAFVNWLTTYRPPRATQLHQFFKDAFAGVSPTDRVGEVIPAWKIMVVAAGSAVLIPSFIASFGHYSPEYAWLSAIPLLVCIAIAIFPIGVSHSRKAVVAALLPFLSSGLPALTAYALTEWKEQDYRPIEHFVGAHIEQDDIVFASYPLYFAAFGKGKETFVGGAFDRMTAAQKVSVTVAVFAGRGNGVGMYDPTIEDALAGFGDQWREIDALVVPRGRLRSRLPPLPKNDYCYEVRVFRRER